MRSLKECYEVVKKYHTYWSGDYHHSSFMCLAADAAFRDRALTGAEYLAVRRDAMALVRSFDNSESSLKRALGHVLDAEVKDYWDKYIDSLENQDDSSEGDYKCSI